MDLAGGAAPKTLDFRSDELLEAPALEIRPSFRGPGRSLLELPDRFVAVRLSGDEALAIDERLHADLDSALDAIERGLECSPALGKEAAQFGLVAVDGAETAWNDRRLAEHALEHLLVRADLLLQPGRVGKPLGKRRLVELLQRDPADDSRQRPFDEQLDLVRTVDGQALRRKLGQSAIPPDDAVEVPAKIVVVGSRRAHVSDRSRFDVGRPAFSSSLRRRSSSSL